MQTTLPDWQQERDRLPTDGQAFLASRASVPIRPRSQQRTRSAFWDITDLRNDLGARVESFRARQQALRAEREAHYADAINRIRSVTTDWKPENTLQAPDPDEQPDAPAAPENVDTGWEKIWLSIERVADGGCGPLYPAD